MYLHALHLITSNISPTQGQPQKKKKNKYEGLTAGTGILHLIIPKPVSLLTKVSQSFPRSPNRFAQISAH